MTNSAVRAVLCAALVASLSACGGGGDSGASDANPAAAPVGASGEPISTSESGGGNTPDPVNRFLGTWISCRPNTIPGSFYRVTTLTKLTASSMAFTESSNTMSGNDCTGAVTASSKGAGTDVIVGTKQIGTETVTKINAVVPGQSVDTKQILIVRADGKLYFGERFLEQGADGFPQVISAFGFTRQ